MNEEIVAIRIREGRFTLELSQTDLAGKLSVAPQTVNGWESGRRMPDPQTLSKLADMYNVSVDYLLGRTDNKNAAVIEDTLGRDHVKIELNKDYFATLTPSDVKDILHKLQSVGFDLNKLI